MEQGALARRKFLGPCPFDILWSDLDRKAHAVWDSRQFAGIVITPDSQK